MKLQYFCQRLRFRIWSQRDAYLLVRPAAVPMNMTWIQNCPAEFHPITPENLEDGLEFESQPHIQTYQNMLAKGYDGQFGYLDGRCVYRAWIQHSGEIRFDGCVVMTLGQHEWYSCYVYCAPEARGKGLHAASIADSVRRLPDCTGYTIVLPEKPWSLNNYLKNGFYPKLRFTVKNRFFHRSLTQNELSEAELEQYFHK